MDSDLYRKVGNMFWQEANVSSEAAVMCQMM